ncbi:MAG: hypothetical protein IJF12_01580 [Alphaproteobacteria bacterium]|nr:hypothetical protein [Alphaproteobacteria bacterium]
MIQKNNFITECIMFISAFSGYMIFLILSLIFLNYAFAIFDDIKYFNLWGLLALTFFWIIFSISVKIEDTEEYNLPKPVKLWTVYVYPTIFNILLVSLIANNFLLSLQYQRVYNLVLFLLMIVCVGLESYIIGTFFDEHLEHHEYKGEHNENM